MAPGGYVRTEVERDTFGNEIRRVTAEEIASIARCRDECDEEEDRKQNEEYRRKLEQARQRGKPLKYG